MLKIICGILLAVTIHSYALAAEVGDDGLHKQDWFAVTFKDITEDIEAAKDSGKRLAIFFEQRGCIYCKEVHEKVLSDPDVRDFIKSNFMVVQYNLYGDEEVIDSDGQSLTEKTAARKWGVLFTPTILFMPEEVSEEKNAQQLAVATMPGAFRKGTFLDMFKWVHQKGYAGEEGFQQFHSRGIKERTASGVTNTD